MQFLAAIAAMPTGAFFSRKMSLTKQHPHTQSVSVFSVSLCSIFSHIVDQKLPHAISCRDSGNAHQGIFLAENVLDQAASSFAKRLCTCRVHYFSA